MYNMTGNDALSVRSDNSDAIGDILERICNYCNKKVGEFVQCNKCKEIFHPSCLLKAASRKTTTCRHEVGIHSENEEESQLKMENRCLQIELSYIRVLLDESNSKNSILMENNQLLHEKIRDLESYIKNNCDNKKKEVNTEMKSDNVGDKQSYPELVTHSSVTNRQPTQVTKKPMLSKSHHRQTTDTNQDDISRLTLSQRSNSNNENSEMRVDANINTDSEWSTVTRKKPNTKKANKKICYGNKTTDQNTTIQGAIRRRWMYVGRISGKDVTEQDISAFLKDVEGHEQIVIKKLNTIGQNSSFSIGLSEEAYKTVFNESFWPVGVIVREFTFNKTFFQKLNDPRATRNP